MSTDAAWESWGAKDPYYGVLTNPMFRADALTEEARDEFFEIGKSHVEHVLAKCRAHLDSAFRPERVLDFGCGVGRVMIPFASHAAEVVGLDISPSMLAEAARNCTRRGITNVSLLVSDDQLSLASGQFDLVHSSIVLQHLEVNRGRRLFALLVDKIRAGGIGAIHVTYGWDVYGETYGVMPPPLQKPAPSAARQCKQTIREWLGRSRSRTPMDQDISPSKASSDDPEMQMNYYNLSELMFILQSKGVRRVFTELTDHGGAMGTFLFFGR